MNRNSFTLSKAGMVLKLNPSVSDLTLDNYYDNGWTDEQLLSAGVAKYVPAPAADNTIKFTLTSNDINPAHAALNAYAIQGMERLTKERVINRRFKSFHAKQLSNAGKKVQQSMINFADAFAQLSPEITLSEQQKDAIRAAYAAEFKTGDWAWSMANGWAQVEVLRCRLTYCVNHLHDSYTITGLCNHNDKNPSLLKHDPINGTQPPSSSAQ